MGSKAPKKPKWANDRVPPPPGWESSGFASDRARSDIFYPDRNRSDVYGEKLEEKHFYPDYEMREPYDPIWENGRKTRFAGEGLSSDQDRYDMLTGGGAYGVNFRGIPRERGDRTDISSDEFRYRMLTGRGHMMRGPQEAPLADLAKREKLMAALEAKGKGDPLRGNLRRPWGSLKK